MDFLPIANSDPEDGDEYSVAANFSTFLARLTRCGSLVYPAFSVWTMRQALEEEIGSQLVVDAYVSSAALWIVFAGQALYTQVVEAPEAQDEPVYNPGELYKGPEMGLERWTFWKKRLIAAAVNKDSREETRRLAERAAGLMDMIELNMRFQRA